MFKSFRDVANYIFDWSSVPGPAYRVRERRQLRVLSVNLSCAAAATVTTASVTANHPTILTLGLAAIAVVAGRYAAGVVIELQRADRARRREVAGLGPL